MRTIVREVVAMAAFGELPWQRTCFDGSFRDGFRMPATEGLSTRTRAGVRKPPEEPTVERGPE